MCCCLLRADAVFRAFSARSFLGNEKRGPRLLPLQQHSAVYLCSFVAFTAAPLSSSCSLPPPRVFSGVQSAALTPQLPAVLAGLPVLLPFPVPSRHSSSADSFTLLLLLAWLCLSECCLWRTSPLAGSAPVVLPLHAGLCSPLNELKPLSHQCTLIFSKQHPSNC